MADDAGMTVSEALRFLDPHIPRRTLERRLATCKPLPELRRPAGRGRPAAAYRVEDVLREHAAWASSNIGKRPAREEPHEELPADRTPNLPDRTPAS